MKKRILKRKSEKQISLTRFHQMLIDIQEAKHGIGHHLVEAQCVLRVNGEKTTLCFVGYISGITKRFEANSPKEVIDMIHDYYKKDIKPEKLPEVTVDEVYNLNIL